jgi:hypothetical protein
VRGRESERERDVMASDRWQVSRMSAAQAHFVIAGANFQERSESSGAALDLTLRNKKEGKCRSDGN